MCGRYKALIVEGRGSGYPGWESRAGLGVAIEDDDATGVDRGAAQYGPRGHLAWLLQRHGQSRNILPADQCLLTI